jgi:acrylyl-CoA reductase (NADPH)
MGPAVVTGAAGGVGSIAISLLAGAGWTVIASTGRPAEAEYLETLGAAQIIERATLSAPGKPLGREQWAAGVDSVGSTTLANMLAQTRYGGAVAACGLAGGMDLPTTVAPFILRGVRLLGVDSVNCPMVPRRAAWERLARDLDRTKLEAITRTFPFDRAFELGARIIKGDLRGRVVLTIA